MNLNGKQRQLEQLIDRLKETAINRMSLLPADQLQAFSEKPDAADKVFVALQQLLFEEGQQQSVD